jgi:hypothetical protein
VLELPLELAVEPRIYLLAEEFEGGKVPLFSVCFVEEGAHEGYLWVRVNPSLEIRHLASDSNLRLHPIFYECVTLFRALNRLPSYSEALL